MIAKALSCLAATLALVSANAPAGAAVLLSEGFDNGIPNSWLTQNFSDAPAGPGWVQGTGDADHFAAHAGAASSYAASTVFITDPDANGEPAGMVDGLLFTPVIDLSEGTLLSFFTRTLTGNAFNEALYIGVVLADGSGGYLGEVLAPYPQDWTEYSFWLPGLGAGVRGSFFFEYFLADAALEGNYIGIDSVTVVPEPAQAWLLLALGSAGALASRRRGRQR